MSYSDHLEDLEAQVERLLVPEEGDDSDSSASHTTSPRAVLWPPTRINHERRRLDRGIKKLYSHREKLTSVCQSLEYSPYSSRLRVGLKRESDLATETVHELLTRIKHIPDQHRGEVSEEIRLIQTLSQHILQTTHRADDVGRMSDIEDEEEDSGKKTNAEGNLMSETHMFVPFSTTDNTDDLYDRSEQLKSLERDVASLCEIFHEMETLVAQQGQEIDQIETSVATSLDSAHGAHTELHAAHKHSRLGTTLVGAAAGTAVFGPAALFLFGTKALVLSMSAGGAVVGAKVSRMMHSAVDEKFDPSKEPPPSDTTTT